MAMDQSWRPKKEPWLPHDYDESTIMAVRAFASGVANDGQQKTVWDYFMYLTGASERFADLSFRPGADGQRATDFAEGKRFVGMQLRKLMAPELTPDIEIPPQEVLTRRQIAQRARRIRERKVRNGQ
jgi:hypothetical protein